jgi:Protein of unknown function (DUF3276).
MEEGNGMNEAGQMAKKFEFFSKVVRAGKRTYFFDMRVTQAGEFYITISESKKCFKQDGRPFYEKHKIFLYPEDFGEFMKGLNHTMNFVKSHGPRLKAEFEANQSNGSDLHEFRRSLDEIDGNTIRVRSYSDVDIEFEDLGNK